MSGSYKDTRTDLRSTPPSPLWPQKGALPFQVPVQSPTAGVRPARRRRMTSSSWDREPRPAGAGRRKCPCPGQSLVQCPRDTRSTAFWVMWFFPLLTVAVGQFPSVSSPEESPQTRFKEWDLGAGARPSLSRPGKVRLGGGELPSRSERVVTRPLGRLVTSPVRLTSGDASGRKTDVREVTAPAGPGRRKPPPTRPPLRALLWASATRCGALTRGSGPGAGRAACEPRSWGGRP